MIPLDQESVIGPICNKKSVFHSSHKSPCLAASLLFLHHFILGLKVGLCYAVLQAMADQAAKAQQAAKPTLAAQLQAANLERFLSDEHPPIRRVKMIGLKAGLLVS